MNGARWRGFTDRVMGGVSDADFGASIVDGRRCARMSGNVTRDSGGGFIQMAMYLDRFSASGYAGLELFVFGNGEDYNLHVKTTDCRRHDQSYRATFHSEPRWQTIRLPWEALSPNRVAAPLDTSNLRRIGLLGWMRDFQADLALGAIALYS
ncbi:MAG: CIA30 family protein [Gammaproteobacteria bacterium]|nr:CIA30 family protein [Gammaproteobacteria bacterium]